MKQQEMRDQKHAAQEAKKSRWEVKQREDSC